MSTSAGSDQTLTVSLDQIQLVFSSHALVPQKCENEVTIQPQVPPVAFQQLSSFQTQNQPTKYSQLLKLQLIQLSKCVVINLCCSPCMYAHDCCVSTHSPSRVTAYCFCSAVRVLLFLLFPHKGWYSSVSYY